MSGTHDALRAMLEGVSSATGPEFFRRLVDRLTLSLGVEYAFVGLLDTSLSRVRMLAMSVEGRAGECVEYALDGSPCCEVIHHGVCVVRDGMQERYPDDAALVQLGVRSYMGFAIPDARGDPVGVLSIMGRAPLADVPRAEDVLRLFATRASGELERMRAARALEESHEELEGRVRERTIALETVNAVLQRQIADRERAQQALRSLVAGTAPVTGDAFFRALVQHLASALGVRYAKIAECLDDQPGRVRVLANWAVDGFSESQEYWIAGTPCENVHGTGNEVCFPSDVQAHYPLNHYLRQLKASCYLGVPVIGAHGRVLGHLYVMDTKPLSDESLARSVLSVLAARAGAELDRMRSYDALGRAEAHFRSLIQDSMDIMAVVDAGGVIEFMSPSVERVLGWKPGELMGASVYDYLHPDDAEIALKAICTSLDGLLASTPMQLRMRHRDGTFRTQEVLGHATSDGGAVPRFIVNCRDITERERLENQLHHAQRLDSIGRLAGGIAHDFNNLLTAVLGHVELLEGQLPLAHPGRDDVAQIRHASECAAALTRQLLTFARRQVVAPVLIDLTQLITELDRMMQPLLGERNALIKRLTPDLGVVRADVAQMQQVVLNLAVNARDAMPDGGNIIIETENVHVATDVEGSRLGLRPGHYVALRVRDNGTGMSAEVQSQLFEPFFSTKERGKGTGLGLATCHGIVAQSGGAIAVESEPGRGSVFTVLLPRVEMRAVARQTAFATAAASVHAPAHADVKTGSETILLVEDETSVRQLLVQMLRGQGYRIIEAKDATQALALARKHGAHIDLLLTDVGLPGVTGVALAERVRRVLPRIPVLFCSGYGHEAMPADGESLPCSAFMQKPFTRASLSHAIRRLLDDATYSGAGQVAC